MYSLFVLQSNEMLLPQQKDKRNIQPFAPGDFRMFGTFKFPGFPILALNITEGDFEEFIDFQQIPLHGSGVKKLKINELRLFGADSTIIFST
jgi:hypothetical protein